MLNYSSDAIKIAWPVGLLFRLEEGLAQGTFVRETRAKPTHVYKDTGMGDVVDMRSHSSHGKLVLTVDRESAQHVGLMIAANLDRVSNSVVGPMFITDKNTRLVQLYNGARIEAIPNYQAGSGPSVASWTFLYGQAVGQTFGSRNNVVGS